MNVQSLVAKVWNFAHVLRDQGVAAEIYKTYLHCAAKIIRSRGRFDNLLRWRPYNGDFHRR